MLLSITCDTEADAAARIAATGATGGVLGRSLKYAFIQNILAFVILIKNLGELLLPSKTALMLRT
jgi:hypothetical protein